MLTNKEIGTRISTARELRGMTLETVASSVGVAKSTIQRYEKGSIAKIKLPVLESIAHSLMVNPNWLIGNTDDPAPLSSPLPTTPAMELTPEEAQLVDDYRDASPEIRGAAAVMLHTSAEANRKDGSSAASSAG